MLLDKSSLRSISKVVSKTSKPLTLRRSEQSERNECDKSALYCFFYQQLRLYHLVTIGEGDQLQLEMSMIGPFISGLGHTDLDKVS